MRTGRERAGWSKREKKEEDAPIVDRKRKSGLEHKREKRGRCSKCGQEEKERVGAKVAEREKLPNRKLMGSKQDKEKVVERGELPNK